MTRRFPVTHAHAPRDEYLATLRAAADIPPVEHERGLTYTQYACAALAPTMRNLGNSGAHDHE